LENVKTTFGIPLRRFGSDEKVKKRASKKEGFLDTFLRGPLDMD